MDKNKKTFIVFLVVFVCLSSFYFGVSWFLLDRFQANTYIGDYNVSFKTEEEAKTIISEDLTGDYVLTVETNDGQIELIFPQNVNMWVNFSFDDIINEQNPVLWITYLFSPSQYDLSYEIEYDADDYIASLSFLQDENMISPQNAYISDYIDGVGYEIVPEINGSLLDKKKTEKALKEALSSLNPYINLTDLGCYKEPETKADSQELNDLLNLLQQSVSAVIEYDFDTYTIVLNADTYHNWIYFDENGLEIDETQAEAFVEELRKTDTAYTERTLISSTDGREVSVTGPYGYRIAPNDERTQLINDIKAGEYIKRKPVYTREGATREGNNDYGGTYVEVDLTNQKVYLYVNYELIDSSSCVTGCVSTGNTTPPGIYPITYTQRNATLTGPGYSSFVNYWMPFNGGIGLHDATWRSSFGGSIYKTNGSHGCINLPYSMAQTIFSYAYAGMPVICYN